MSLIASQIIAARDQWPRRLAVQSTTGSIDYNGLVGHAASIAHMLLEHSPSRGGLVGILVADPIGFLAAFLGTVLAGKAAVPLSERWAQSQIDDALTVCRPELVLIDHGTLFSSPNITTLPVPPRDALAKIPNQSFDDSDLFYVGFTSGSTGAPRAFGRDHRAWASSFDAMNHHFSIAKHEDATIPGSLFFSFPLISALHTLNNAGTIMIPATAGAADVYRAIKQTSGTLFALPSILDQLARFTIRSGANHSLKTIVCGGEPLMESTVRNLEEAFPRSRLFQFYGATEFGFATIQTPESRDMHPSSVGTPMYGTEISIGVGTASGSVAQPEDIYVRNSFGPTVEFRANLPTWMPHGSWRTAHDLGYIDSDGFVYLSGRQDTMVVIRGINIHLEVIERTIAQIPGVTDAVALPWPSEQPTHVVAVVVTGERPIPSSDIIDYCRRHLSSIQIPRRCKFVAEIPRNPSGKIDRASAARIP